MITRLAQLPADHQNAAGVATALYIPLLWGAFFSDLGGVVGRVSQATPSHFMCVGRTMRDSPPSLEYRRAWRVGQAERRA